MRILITFLLHKKEWKKHRKRKRKAPPSSAWVMSEKVCKILLVLSPMLGKPKHEGNL